MLPMIKTFHTLTILTILNFSFTTISVKAMLTSTKYKFLIFNKRNKVGMIKLNNPPVNALSEGLMQDLDSALKECAKDKEIHCIILMGSQKYFSAGADIKEMYDKNYIDAYNHKFLSTGWDTIRNFRKPIFAGVRGPALGGGCELAQQCNFIIASETAQFGQPEIKIGTIPGAGGTQLLRRYIGKGNAMYYALTGRTMNAQEAKTTGLVSYIVPNDIFEEEALKIGNEIASYSLNASMDIIEAINQSCETPLSAGLKIERNLFNATFARKDQKAGMTAFVEKRLPIIYNNE
jgi:enoyl-CoA hydratase